MSSPYFDFCIQVLEEKYTTKLTERELKFYDDHLHGVPEDVLVGAIKRIMQAWRPQFGVNFPPIEDVLEYCASEKSDLDASRKTKTEKAADLINVPEPLIEAAKKAGITAEEIAAWHEAGERRQLQHIAELRANPQWAEMAERLGGRPSTTGNYGEVLAAEHNGKTQVPTDPEKRRAWASKKAAEMTWPEPGTPR